MLQPQNFQTFSMKVLGLTEGHTRTVKQIIFQTDFTYILLRQRNPSNKKGLQAEPPLPTKAQIADITSQLLFIIFG